MQVRLQVPVAVQDEAWPGSPWNTAEVPPAWKHALKHASASVKVVLQNGLLVFWHEQQVCSTHSQVQVWALKTWSSVQAGTQAPVPGQTLVPPGQGQRRVCGSQIPLAQCSFRMQVAPAGRP